MIPRARRLLFAGLIASFAAVAGISTLASAASPGPATVTAQAMADDTIPPFAVEDFEYPGAQKILEEKGITLRKGDGRILLADCDPAQQQIQVWTRKSSAGMFCFQATAKTGHLTLEVPDVFALQTSDRAISADLTAQGKTQTVNVPKDKLQGVGEGTGGGDAVLVELRVTG
ncbi:hypothetical protein [Streptomyces sp. NPDC088400]|uniref:hypothetical protein n=1 Tax=Streptomyces sp. NPDC088400 TaxID=3365861 RepID=UPI0037F6E865